jgi:multisubunit Na+/H+ antiporter MnhB subunit
MAFGGVLNVVGFATAGLLLFLIYHIQKTRRLPLTAWISAIIVAMILTLILTSVELPIATRLRQITSTYF